MSEQAKPEREHMTLTVAHPGTSLDHLRAAVAHLTRALGLAFGEGVDKEARVAVRAARDLMHEAIEALTRQEREAVQVECVECVECREEVRHDTAR